uniref:uncharacterized protein LOC120340926 n=1 Tax=Styela clava TaxID=7725 RepID=UPI00193AC4CB|nr:uncharacterized protein LOC120340926 [Styela clava]
MKKFSLRFIICFPLLFIPVICQDDETVIHCSSKPGCLITQCDPTPKGLNGVDIEGYMNRNEFPITCKSKLGQSKGLEAEMAKFKREMRKELTNLKQKQERSLKEMTEKLNAAETLITDLLSRSQIPGLATPACDPPGGVEFGSVTCSDKTYKSGTVCTVQCLPNREMKGATKIICLDGGKWSNLLPTCECGNCKIGDDCGINTSWKDFRSHIRGDGTFNYAGHQMNCKTSGYIHSWSLKWKCECTDTGTGTRHSCKGYSSGEGSCEHATAKLIKEMIAKKVYPSTCDEMANGC